MNNNIESRLLRLLDLVFGYENKIKSRYKKLRQSYNAMTDEHIFLIEYRIQVAHHKTRQEVYNVREDDRLTDTDLLSDINDRVNVLQSYR